MGSRSKNWAQSGSPRRPPIRLRCRGVRLSTDAGPNSPQGRGLAAERPDIWDENRQERRRGQGKPPRGLTTSPSPAALPADGLLQDRRAVVADMRCCGGRRFEMPAPTRGGQCSSSVPKPVTESDPERARAASAPRLPSSTSRQARLLGYRTDRQRPLRMSSISNGG